jgi:uncharacterized protein YjbJ (UPF0337 family)
MEGLKQQIESKVEAEIEALRNQVKKSNETIRDKD